MPSLDHRSISLLAAPDFDQKLKRGLVALRRIAGGVEMMRARALSRRVSELKRMSFSRGGERRSGQLIDAR